MKQIVWSLFLLVPTFIFGQKLKVNLDPTGKTYIKGGVRANFWARHYQTNPNTTMNGEAIKSVSDISIRRLRINLEGQLTPKLFFYSNFGNNDINFVTERHIQFDVLDMYFEYEFNKAFALGFGEIGWAASRGNSRSSKTMMGLDTPLFSLFTVNKNDNLARNLGLFAKGNIGKWNYVATVKNPIKITDAPKLNVVDFANGAPEKQYSLLLKYDFLDVESNKNSYSGGAGTYIGTKKIFNISAGGVFQKKMMSEKLNDDSVQFYDYKNISTELFLDTPISEKNDAITAYLAFFHTDFGRNYLRYVGANDVTDASATGGNKFPMMGSGNTLFFQGGYLLPKFEKLPRIQPHISIQHSKFHALNDAVTVYDLGVNLFMKGHDQKLTLSYQNRPLFDNGSVTSRKGMVILQYQIELN